MACANPVDAYWMIQQAVASDDPVIFFEPKRRYHEKAEVDEAATPLRCTAPRWCGRARTSPLVTYGPTVRTCLAAAEAAAEDGIDLEVIDLRSLSPLDLGPVVRSAGRTGRVVVVHEAPLTLGLGAEVAARVTEQCFYSLEAPVLRVTGFDLPYPPSRVEDEYLPDLDRVLDAVDRSLAY